jgi:hypothetical protein
MDIDSEEFLMAQLQVLPRLNSVDAKLVMTDLYEAKFGIYNHLVNKSRPLASVAMQPCEDINDGSLFSSVASSYHDKKIFDFFHLDLFQFLDLPPDCCEILIDIADKRLAKKATDEEKMANQLK